MGEFPVRSETARQVGKPSARISKQRVAMAQVISPNLGVIGGPKCRAVARGSLVFAVSVGGETGRTGVAWSPRRPALVWDSWGGSL